ncbi:MAG: hypothetical protein A2Y67_02540 [Candidatus Buchananbacteria bacterium RBG_13_39_9]|uniref:Uncharacterized protein n=1 Tax=Candidatus Buchananbacteria bacterium RBG_13_39_9 TaxID=1797531 RepID=A0A1G1XRS0_9BACT|nr:MAG: hypothetical protein A2Y67_02540 [Candidatus Buchananbacteria bacterium RBG_13_39_9]
MPEIDHCVHLRDLLAAQRTILEKHLSEHKWFRHIPDEEEGKEDFIREFGWVMREFYCGFACPDRFECEIAQEYLPKDAKKGQPQT